MEVPISVSHARNFAVAAHGDKLYGKWPYSAHLDKVASLVRPYGYKAAILAYLHDVLEDTSVSAQQIEAEFGLRVRRGCELLCDPPGENRADRKIALHDRLTRLDQSIAVESLVLIVKAGDRLANVQASWGGGSQTKLKMYRSEHPAFRDAAYRPRLCDNIWSELDSLVSRSNGLKTWGIDFK